MIIWLEYREIHFLWLVDHMQYSCLCAFFLNTSNNLIGSTYSHMQLVITHSPYVMFYNEWLLFYLLWFVMCSEKILNGYSQSFKQVICKCRVFLGASAAHYRKNMSSFQNDKLSKDEDTDDHSLNKSTSRVIVRFTYNSWLLSNNRHMI